MAGPNRAASWLWRVFNPWLDAMEREHALLIREDPSTHFQGPELTRIRPLRDHLDPENRHVAQDCLANHPDVADAARERDEARTRLEQVAVAARDALAADAAFKAAVYENARAFSARGEYPGGAVREEMLPLASNVVNNVHELPRTYTDADFWKQHGAELLKWRQSEHLRGLGPAMNALLSRDQALTEVLSSRRDQILDRYDIPADPAPLLFHDE